MLKLIGIAIVTAGFALRLNPLLVVVAAGLATGLVAGLPFHELVAELGRLFIQNRALALPAVLMLPVIGLLERHGLQERAETLIRRARSLTAGRVLLLYTAVRQAAISVGIPLGGQASAVRPIIAPMAEGAARATSGELSPELAAAIRAHAAAADNVGNFFGEDIFVAVGGVLLMRAFFQAQGMVVGLWSLAGWGIPTALAAFGVMAWRCRALDRRIRRGGGPAQRPERPEATGRGPR
jgi:uncharacterized membrane protein